MPGSLYRRAYCLCLSVLSSSTMAVSASRRALFALRTFWFKRISSGRDAPLLRAVQKRLVQVSETATAAVYLSFAVLSAVMGVDIAWVSLSVGGLPSVIARKADGGYSLSNGL